MSEVRCQKCKGIVLQDPPEDLKQWVCARCQKETEKKEKKPK